MAERKIILAVDDMPENLMLLGSLLEDYFDVRLVKSASAALELLQGTKVDLILLDIEMPGMSGFDFLRMLKQKDEKNKKAPVLFVTSHADTALIEKAISSGAKDYLVKPIKADLLYKKIDTIIGMPKFKANSTQGKLEQLLTAVTSGDTSRAKTLIKELSESDDTYICNFMEELEKLLLAFDYKQATEKIKELQSHAAVFNKE